MSGMSRRAKGHGRHARTTGSGAVTGGINMSGVSGMTGLEPRSHCGKKTWEGGGRVGGRYGQFPKRVDSNKGCPLTFRKPP